MTDFRGVDVPQPISVDLAIADALDSGELTTDPVNGHVHRRSTGRRATGSPNQHGYLQVAIGRRKALVHRIVWIDANGPIPTGLVLNHMNGVRDDNRLVNLELVTQKQNIAHGKAAAAIREWQGVTEHMNADWLDEVKAAALSGNVTREEVARLLAAANAA